MKKLITIFILIIAASSVYAQPISNVRSSALTDESTVVFNLDFIDPFGLPGIDISIIARMGTQHEEFEIPLTHVNFPPYYENTYEAEWIFEEPGASITYYGRAQADTLVITQSYKNAGNQMPPDGDIYADLIGDPVGDTLPGTAGEWLDLTGTAITYSDTRLFGKLDNVNNDWPDNQGQDFYFYAFLMHPTDSLSTNVTAMVYGNIPFFFEPGLYSLSLIDTSFTYIADIDYSIDQFLHMSCDIDDLLSAPGWDTWPPENGFIITGAATFTITFTTPVFNDFTYPSAFIPETQYLQTTENSAPQIEWEISPMPEEFIDAYVTYSDPDNNLPVEKTFYFDGQPHEMGTYDRDYTDMAHFEDQIDWPGGDWHTYYFRFSDGAEVVETELDSVYLSPIAVDDNPVPSRFALIQNYPNPFNAETSIRFDIAKPSHVNLSIHDISGGIVATLEDSYLQAGSHSITWDGRNSAGQTVSSGVYFYKLNSEGYTDTRRMLLLK
ncbi:MAG: FlgD immunoglobulin-like domain containing protein [candidate division Zixibacteria bacterium]